MPVELLEIVKAGGAVLTPFFAFLWWREAQKNDRLFERAISALENNKFVFDQLSSILKTGRGDKD